MKKNILTFSLLILFAFASNNSFALDTQASETRVETANIQLPEIDIDPSVIMEETENNKVSLIIIASLSVLLILFILFWLGARGKAIKRKLESKDSTLKLQAQTKELNAFKQETLKLRTENGELTVLLEKEKTNAENLNDKIQEFKDSTTTLSLKVEELQNKVKPAMSDATRKEIDSLELKSAKLQNIAKLKEQNAITEVEAKEMKAKLLKDFS